DLIVLDLVAEQHDLPSPLEPITDTGVDEHSRFLPLMRSASGRITMQTMSPRLSRLMNTPEHFKTQTDFIPVSIFWGRALSGDGSWLKVLTSENWAASGRFKRVLNLFLNRRNIVVHFGQPLSLAEAASTEDPDIALRRTARYLRVRLRRQRIRTLGPDFSHRRTLVDQIVNSSSVKAAISAQSFSSGEGERKLQKRAYAYARTISSDMAHPTVRVLARFLSWFWQRIYDDVVIHGLDNIEELALTHTLVYAPSHRSHLDYLLLSYLLYYKNFMIPHIASGDNLNLPILGSILRRGGAFFMRRSFKDNPLYATVFNEYMHVMFTRGYSVEYFVEGGRSRTGRMLPPRPGMLSMTVRSFLRDHRKPIVFVPVYIGYEKVMEGRSYLGELRGKKKQKESIFGLAKTARKLTNSFGRVAVNFGDPIHLDKVLDDVHESWRHEAYDTEYRPSWLNQAVDNLSQRVASNINASVAVNPIGMTATVLLGTERLAMDEGQLIRLLDKYADLLRAYPYAETITLPEGSGRDWIAYCENMGLITRQPQKLGDIIALEGSNAILMTYYRNNIQHLFALPALIASLFENKASLSREKIVFLTGVAYPYLQSELFLQYDQEKVDAVINQWIDVLVDQGLLIRLDDERLGRPEEGTEAMLRSRILSRFIIQTLERYHITLGILRKYGSGNLTAAELEEQSTLLAERMSILFGLNAPEFFDKTLFRNFIANMQKNGVLTTDEDGRLCYGEGLDEVAEDARLVLSVEKRQAIQQVTMLDA
ncbi:glycerol-3-phosphate 1-O-acyltransferase PlsB, partial [Marinobacter nauticus]|uniref:glycerol-3-phosphate 1-O-acyltransferase PlsB n=1 Tax=Marinobacter nauticus TaxID=2743 RepID=UPI0032B12C69